MDVLIYNFLRGAVRYDPDLAGLGGEPLTATPELEQEAGAVQVLDVDGNVIATIPPEKEDP